jgi:Leucine-rich repeat (LRR) protein
MTKFLAHYFDSRSNVPTHSTTNLAGLHQIKSKQNETALWKCYMVSPQHTVVSSPTITMEEASREDDGAVPRGAVIMLSKDGVLTDLQLDDYNTSTTSTNQNHSLPHVEDVRFGISSFGNNNSTSIRCRRRRVLLQFGIRAGMVVLLLMLIIIPVVVIVMTSHQNSSSNTNNMSSRFQETIAYLQQYHVDPTAALTTTGSPQFRAAQWMANVDEASLPLSHDDNGRFLQRYALVVFYYSTQTQSVTWKHSLNFLSKQDECEWNFKVQQGRNENTSDSDSEMGVFCNDKDVVTRIVIEDMGLTGTLPVELSLLSDLTHLVLPRNQLYGSLPQQWVELTELTHLILNQNDFVQPLPSWMGDLTNLQYLDLSHNGFYSSLPDEFEQLDELTLLALEANHLTGNLDSLALLQQLQHLYLQDNQFTGTIDYHWMTTLIDLRTLDASNNLLEGGIPYQLLELSQLQVLDLHDNNLSGTIESVTQNVDTLHYARRRRKKGCD